jgi:hypothetical protein
MGAHIAVVIDWYGPYHGIQEAKKAAKSDWVDGFYLLIGKEKYQKSPPKLLYVGISDYLPDRVTPQHPILPYISGEPMVWLGYIVTYGIPGRANKKLLQLAEWAIAYFLELPLNTKKTAYPPNDPITVFNRWWKKDYETPRKQRPHPHWPDVIDFAGWEYGARVGWLGYSDRWGKEDF